jgi:protein-tyrosine-phosphatase
MSESQLFVCVHNAGRSRMAAGLLRLRSGGRINVRSAGSTPAGEVNPAAVWALETVRRIRDEIDRRVQGLIGELLPDDPAPAS